MKISPSSSSRWTLAACLLLLVLGLLALGQATLGFRVLATEDARRLLIREHPLALPLATLSMPGPLELQQDLRADGRIAIVTFFYSQCNAVCSVLGNQYQQMQAALLARGMQQQVRLLSISFDGRDTPAALASYARAQHARGELWQFAGIADAASRSALLRAFGIVVLPVPLGQFQHNAAFHVVDADGRLLRIFDLDEQDAALDYAIGVARQGRAHD